MAAIRLATGAFLFSASELQRKTALHRWGRVPQHRLFLPPARRRRVFYFTEPRPPSAEICLRHFASQSRRALCCQKTGCCRTCKSSIQQGCFPVRHRLRQRAAEGFAVCCGGTAGRKPALLPPALARASGAFLFFVKQQAKCPHADMRACPTAYCSRYTRAVSVK